MKIDQLKFNNFTTDDLNTVIENLTESIKLGNFYSKVKKELTPKGISIFANILLYLFDKGIDNKEKIYSYKEYHYDEFINEKSYSFGKNKIQTYYNAELTKEDIIKRVRIGDSYKLMKPEYLKSLLDDLGYKKGNIIENTKIIKFIEKYSLINFRGDEVKDLSEHKLLSEYPEMRYVMYSRNHVRDGKYLISRLKSDISVEERFLIYQCYYREGGNELEINNMVETDLRDKKLFELFEKANNTTMRLITKTISGGERTEIFNLCPATYTCSIVINYHQLRANIGGKYKSKVTDLLYKLANTTAHSTGYKNDYLILIVKSEFPIKQEELDNFISENILTWLKKDFSWDVEMESFISSQREKILKEKIAKSDKEIGYEEVKGKKKI